MMNRMIMSVMSNSHAGEWSRPIGLDRIYVDQTTMGR